MAEVFTLGEEKKATDDDCKGLSFRGYNNMFRGSDGRIEWKQGIKPLKRKSCPGCNRCGPILDSLKEDVFSGSVVFPEEIKNGAEYTVRIVVDSVDGRYADEWHTEIIEVKNGSKRSSL